MLSKDSWGLSHLSGLPVTVVYGLIILFAFLALVALRHFFGGIRVEAGVR